MMVYVLDVMNVVLAFEIVGLCYDIIKLKLEQEKES